MSDMIERVARAICKRQTGIRSGYETFSQNDIELARAAIEAMREPTKTMLAATVPFPEHLVFQRDAPDYEKRMAAATLADRMGVRSDWQTMIDAALSRSP